MRIAIIGQKGIPTLFGGVERHVEELSVSLAQRGHAVTVYTRPYYTNPQRRAWKGVHLVSLPSVRTKHLDAISHTLLATFHAILHNFDVVHFQGVGPALLSFLPRVLRPRMRVIVTFHCLDRLHKKWGAFARTMLRLGEWAAVTFPHRTIVISRTVQRYCRRRYGAAPVYIPYGVSFDAPSPRSSAGLTRRFGLHADRYILVVSRLIPHKGIHYLIEAYKRLRTTKKLVIVGDAFYTDDYARQLRTLAGNDPRIVFTGFQHGAALANLYAHAYLFVLPSETEGLPMVLLEAARAGTCVLASNIPENMEMIKADGETIGCTFRNKDTDDLTRKLRELLQQPLVIKRKGRLAQNVVRRVFNWQTVTRDIERVYAAG